MRPLGIVLDAGVQDRRSQDVILGYREERRRVRQAPEDVSEFYSEHQPVRWIPSKTDRGGELELRLEYERTQTVFRNTATERNTERNANVGNGSVPRLLSSEQEHDPGVEQGDGLLGCVDNAVRRCRRRVDYVAIEIRHGEGAIELQRPADAHIEASRCQGPIRRSHTGRPCRASQITDSQRDYSLGSQRGIWGGLRWMAYLSLSLQGQTQCATDEESDRQESFHADTSGV